MFELFAWTVLMVLSFGWGVALTSALWIRKIHSIDTTQVTRLEGKKISINIGQVNEVWAIIKRMLLG